MSEATGLPISEVSRQLGVPIPTLRSWEVRHGIPPTQRDAGKHRRYTPDELHALRLMRDEIARGKRASLAADSVRGLLGIAGPAAGHIAAILEASTTSDSAAIHAVLTAAHEELGLGPCLDDVLLPAMQQIGLWWQTGRCTVEDEHLTTETARSWVERMNTGAPRPTHEAPIVLACGPTDLHTIGLESLCLLLRYDGWACRLLGARVPIPALTAAVHASGAKTVVIVSHLNSGRARAVQSMRAADALGVRLFYAGNSFTSPRSRRGLPGAYLGARLQDACALIDVLPLVTDDDDPVATGSDELAPTNLAPLGGGQASEDTEVLP